MQTPHQCSGCLSRRHCLQLITTAAAGLAFSGEFFPALAKARKADPDFVDPEMLRPHPKVRVDAAILQQPRPYWLGWPGTTYNLDKHQKEYRSAVGRLLPAPRHRAARRRQAHRRRGRDDLLPESRARAQARRPAGYPPAHGLLELGQPPRQRSRRAADRLLPRRHLLYRPCQQRVAPAGRLRRFLARMARRRGWACA